MSDLSVRANAIAGNGARRATAGVFLIHDHRGLAHARHRWRISSVGLGVRRRVSLKCSCPLALDHRASHHAMRLAGILAALEAFAYGAALGVFRASLRSQIIRMAAAQRVCSFALLVSRIIDRLGVDRPET